MRYRAVYVVGSSNPAVSSCAHPLLLLQLLLDLSALMAVPSLRVFCLESTETLDEDPEGMLQVRKPKYDKQMFVFFFFGK